MQCHREGNVTLLAEWNIKEGGHRVRQLPQLIETKGSRPDFAAEVAIEKAEKYTVIPQDDKCLLFQCWSNHVLGRFIRWQRMGWIGYW